MGMLDMYKEHANVPRLPKCRAWAQPFLMLKFMFVISAFSKPSTLLATATATRVNMSQLVLSLASLPV